jgi:hypothetical protein
MTQGREVTVETPDHADMLLPMVVASMAFIAICSVLCMALVHQGCFEISAPFPDPIPGTPRADYCDSVNSVTPWISLTLVPTALMGVIGWVCRGRPRLVIIAVCVLSLLLIANAILANSLTYSLTLKP